MRQRPDTDLTNTEIISRTSIISNKIETRKWRKGEYFDRYLYKLLREFDLDLSEYYYGIDLIS